MKFDASAIIYTVKADLIELFLTNYLSLRITESVFNEVVEKGRKRGFSDAYVINNYIEKKKITVIPDEKSLPIESSNLGVGERTSIAEARTHNELLIIDDIKARNRAKSLQVEFLGTDGLLLDAYLSYDLSFSVFQEKLRVLAEVMQLKASKVMKILEVAKKQEM